MPNEMSLLLLVLMSAVLILYLLPTLNTSFVT